MSTELTITEALALDPNIQMTGPHTPGAVGMEEVNVRSVVYAPPPYVPLVMHGYLSPRQAWERLSGTIIAAGKQVEYRSLIRVAITRASLL